MTMNGAVLPILALYIAAAGEQGVPPTSISLVGTVVIATHLAWVRVIDGSGRDSPRVGQSVHRMVNRFGLPV